MVLVKFDFFIQFIADPTSLSLSKFSYHHHHCLSSLTGHRPRKKSLKYLYTEPSGWGHYKSIQGCQTGAPINRQPGVPRTLLDRQTGAPWWYFLGQALGCLDRDALVIYLVDISSQACVVNSQCVCQFKQMLQFSVHSTVTRSCMLSQKKFLCIVFNDLPFRLMRSKMKKNNRFLKLRMCTTQSAPCLS